MVEILSSLKDLNFQLSVASNICLHPEQKLSHNYNRKHVVLNIQSLRVHVLKKACFTQNLFIFHSSHIFILLLNYLIL